MLEPFKFWYWSACTSSRVVNWACSSLALQRWRLTFSLQLALPCPNTKYLKRIGTWSHLVFSNILQCSPRSLHLITLSHVTPMIKSSRSLTQGHTKDNCYLLLSAAPITYEACLLWISPPEISKPDFSESMQYTISLWTVQTTAPIN